VQSARQILEDEDEDGAEEKGDDGMMEKRGMSVPHQP
jgi:hypothetical protein